MNAVQCRWIVAAGLCLAMLSGANAQQSDKGKAKGKRKNSAAAAAVDAVFSFPSEINLTPEQTRKLEALKKEFGPKIEAAAAKASEEAVMTPEQKSKRKEARDTAKSEGRKGKDLRAAVESAASLTEQQIKRLDEAKAELSKLQESTRSKVLALLDDEQKAKLKKASPPAKRKKKKDGE